jgi:hypothetical protein
LPELLALSVYASVFPLIAIDLAFFQSILTSVMKTEAPTDWVNADRRQFLPEERM